MQETPRDPLVDLDRILKLPFGQTVSHRISEILERILGLTEVNKLYQTLPAGTTSQDFFEAGLAQLKVGYRVVSRLEHPLPERGPLLVLANHPFGGVDGLILGAMVSRWRPDMRLIVNYLLRQIPELHPWIIPVDPFGRPDSPKTNLAGMRTCIRYLRDGGCLATFPSGEVSHWQPGKGGITDPEWSPHLAGLARRAGATVVPVYFDGRNSMLFHLLGLIHERLRTLRLPSELLNKKESVLTAVVGDPIPAKRLAAFADDRKATDYIKLQTTLLRGRIAEPEKKRRRVRADRVVRNGEAAAAMKPIAPPLDTKVMEAEIGRLPDEARLLSQGRFDVIVARREQIPQILQEIGRVREMTFREAHEGTGKPLDLDRFDDTYLQLFLWDREERAVAGAYRMGLTDQLLREEGRAGIYTHTLFRMRPAFLEEIQPAIELGRSFIVPEYQRKHATLVLLWKGIGAFLVRNPQYRFLFGPVSIDNQYQALSKDVMVQFLTGRRMAEKVSSWVRPRHPLRIRSLKKDERRAIRQILSDIDDVSALISEIEDSGKGVPVLLRHYVKLNARLIAFNIDPDFNDAVDSLMVVDATRIDRRMLEHYLGREGAARYLEHPREAVAGMG